MTRRIRRSVALVAISSLALLAACGDPDQSDSSSPSGATGNGVCAPADGSAEKQQQFDDFPGLCLRDGMEYRATIETNHGTLHVLLRADIAPIAVNSFVNLARFHYFDGTTCHRAIQGFVVQCGDPTGTGAGDPGYEFADELDGIDGYRLGSIAMANSGPDTNGSQFFIITGDSGTLLPHQYTLFGQVDDDDMGIVAALDSVSNPQDGPPLEPIDITSIVIDER